MELFWYGVLFVLGTIIGSFLNVVIYRLHTGKSLNGRSHCMSCGKTLAWFELFPIFSYLFQWGRCRGCSSYIPSRYLTVELCTGLLYVLVWHLYHSELFLVAVNAVLMSALVVITVYDMRHTIIPDEMSIFIGALALVFLGYDFYHYHDVMRLLWSICAGFGAFMFFGGLWYISHGKWIGFGDAKLALPLGIIVGLHAVFSMVVLSFWIGAVVSLTILGVGRLLKSGKTHLHFLSVPLTIKSEVPFAPFLILGFLLVHFFHANIFTITYSVFFW